MLLSVSYLEHYKKMRDVGKLAAECLNELSTIIKPGIRTIDIDTFVRDFASKHVLICAPYGYGATDTRMAFPAACCTSVNHVICHGIPSSDKVLNDGDIVTVDVTFIKNGWYGDSCRTYPVGTKINAKISKLLQVTEQAMWKGIDAARPGNTIGDIGRSIQNYVESCGFSVVRDFVGHGIGREFHTPPAIPHYITKEMPDVHRILQPGLCFTVEPMITAGKKEYKELPDGWTVVTRDRSWSAQFEHTIGITEDGHEVFTL